MNSLLSKVHTTYGMPIVIRFRASWSLITNFPLGGPSRGPGGAGLLVVEAARLGRSEEPALVGAVSNAMLPVDVVPRGVAGGVSFSSKATFVSFDVNSSNPAESPEGPFILNECEETFLGDAGQETVCFSLECDPGVGEERDEN